MIGWISPKHDSRHLIGYSRWQWHTCFNSLSKRRSKEGKLSSWAEMLMMDQWSSTHNVQQKKLNKKSVWTSRRAWQGEDWKGRRFSSDSLGLCSTYVYVRTYVGSSISILVASKLWHWNCTILASDQYEQKSVNNWTYRRGKIENSDVFQVTLNALFSLQACWRLGTVHIGKPNGSASFPRKRANCFKTD